MPRYRARIEFRRRSRGGPWVLAAAIVGDCFEPATPAVEPIRARLPEPGLVGWEDLDTPIVASDPATAAGIALEVARMRWPERHRPTVPWAAGVADE